MIILDGKKTANKILQKVSDSLIGKPKPHLCVILVGSNPASTIYVRNKEKTAEKIGIQTTIINYPETVTEDEVLNKIDELNKNLQITGILVQLPLPQHIDNKKIIKAISPLKDVDGFTPENVGRLATGLEPYFYPATPQGVIMLLDEYNIDIDGKDAVVIGRSNIVGKPMAQMLLKRNATVTICHSYTKNLDDKIKTADIIVSAVGKQIVRCKMVNKPVLVDVGIHKDSEGRLCGDVDFKNVAETTGYISPVPGGVGPMTIASLMFNASKIYFRD